MADKGGESACPVDHKSREAWLSQARAAEASQAQTPSAPSSSASACPVDHSARNQKPATWSQTISSYLPWSSTQPSSQPPSQTPRPAAAGGLGTDRVISSIPRSTTNASACPVEHGASANAEIESGAHDSGNWVYPSEKMFFDAMKRKGYDARTTDMKTVVPIHNAVNERAWAQILQWERPYLAQSQYAPLSTTVLC
jgi:cytochrome c heme-lyase